MQGFMQRVRDTIRENLTLDNTEKAFIGFGAIAGAITVATQIPQLVNPATEENPGNQDINILGTVVAFTCYTIAMTGQTWRNPNSTAIQKVSSVLATTAITTALGLSIASVAGVSIPAASITLAMGAGATAFAGIMYPAHKTANRDNEAQPLVANP